MARIRSIKPEFFTSEQLSECSMNARLMFIGLWVFSDDSGIHVDSPARIKMEIFPADTISRKEIAALVSELGAAGLVQQYAVDGQPYIQITGWRKHQRIDQPSYKHPLPNGQIPSNVRRTSFAERSTVGATNVRGGSGDRAKSLRARAPAAWIGSTKRDASDETQGPPEI